MRKLVGIAAAFAIFAVSVAVADVPVSTDPFVRQHETVPDQFTPSSRPVGEAPKIGDKMIVKWKETDKYKEPSSYKQYAGEMARAEQLFQMYDITEDLNRIISMYPEARTACIRKLERVKFLIDWLKNEAIPQMEARMLAEQREFNEKYADNNDFANKITNEMIADGVSDIPPCVGTASGTGTKTCTDNCSDGCTADGNFEESKTFSRSASCGAFPGTDDINTIRTEVGGPWPLDTAFARTQYVIDHLYPDVTFYGMGYIPRGQELLDMRSKVEVTVQ